MSILNKKEQIFGNIAAAKTLTESMPILKTTSSLPSVNNQGKTIEFLTDLMKVLLGYWALVTAIIDMLTHAINDIEPKIKKALKINLKQIVTCGIDPSLPAFIKSTGNGVVIELKKIDFFDLMKVDPTSTEGNLLYLDANDFNTFLYNVVQDDGNTHTWNNILDITFYSIDPNGVNPNNSLVIKANPSYDNKSLNDLNNNYVDSIRLFNTEKLLNRIIDSIFGSVSVNLNKTKKQLENEAKIDSVIDKMINSDAGQDIDDSYFEFDNVELSNIQYTADNRQNGVIKLKTSEDIDASVSQTSLVDFNDDMGKAVTIQEKKDTLAKHLDSMADENAKNSTDPQDKESIKLNFIQKITDALIKTIATVMLSPKVVLIILLNFKIVWGESVGFDDAVDFLKKNKQLIYSIVKTITKIIVDKLLAIVLKSISKLMLAETAARQIEKIKNKLSQMLSLVGVPQEAINAIKGLM